MENKNTIEQNPVNLNNVPESNKKEGLIYQPEKTFELASELKDALAIENEEVVRKILEDAKARKGFIVSRGKQGENLKLLKEGVGFLIRKEFKDPEVFMNVETKKIINWLHEVDLPEGILSDMTSVFYHLKDKNKKESNDSENIVNFFRFLQIIEENELEIENREVVYEAEHNLATWEKEICNNFYASEKHNLGLLNKEDVSPIIVAKARFGIAYNREIKPRKKAEEFEKIMSIMNELGDYHDAVQAMSVAAKSYLALAERQMKSNPVNQSSLIEENLGKAEVLAFGALEKAEDLKYLKAKIRAMEVIIDLFDLTGFNKKAGRWRKILEKAKKDLK